jgi:hypothetical protein
LKGGGDPDPDPDPVPDEELFEGFHPNPPLGMRTDCVFTALCMSWVDEVFVFLPGLKGGFEPDPVPDPVPDEEPLEGFHPKPGLGTRKDWVFTEPSSS